MSKTILVTGGAGFIGANLIRVLLDKGHKVVCVDNLSAGSFEKLPKHENLFNVFGDITDKSLIYTLSRYDFDEIYNLACPASPPRYQEDPIHTWMTNTIGVLNMLELARLDGAKFLQASTSEVYGDPLVKEQNEEYKGNVSTIGPRACYDEGKRAAEALVMDYHREYGVDTRIVRIFNTYGPYMDVDDGRVISNFIDQALEGKPLTVYGNGMQTRSFCYVDDLVNGLLALMDSGYNLPVNIGNPMEFTILGLTTVLMKYFSDLEIEFKDLPVDDPRQRKPDINLAKEVLGWEPTVSLGEGLKHTIDYFKNVQSNII